MPNQSIATALHALGASRAEVLITHVGRPPTTSAAVVRSEAEATPRADTPTPGRSIATAAAASFAIVLVAVTAGLMAAGTPFVDSLGIGAFSAVWGGGGFGAMIGGVVHVHRCEEPVVIPSLVGSELDRSPALLPSWPSSTPVPGRR